MVDERPVFADLFPDLRTEGKTVIRQAQLVMIRMLLVFDHICRSEGIAYWLTAGTLIGALRHRGFIPWDQDIDVGMTEEDYSAFLEVKDQLPPDIFFQDRGSEPTFDDSVVKAKLRDRYSNYPRWQSEHPEVVWHNGLQLDILLYPRDEAGRLVNPARGTPYLRDEIFPLRTLEYEGANLPVPKDPAYYIGVRYGDYMTLPPAHERVVHDDDVDPFSPCDHPESLAWPGQRPRTVRPGMIARLRSLVVSGRKSGEG